MIALEKISITIEKKKKCQGSQLEMILSDKINKFLILIRTKPKEIPNRQRKNTLS
jgi:hypothetical protein